MFLLKTNLKKFIVPIVIVFCSVISSSNIVFAQDNLLALESSQNGSTNRTESNGIVKETLNRLNFFTYLYFKKIPNLEKTNFFFIDDNFCKITDQTLIDQYKLIKGEFIGKIKRTGLNGPVENFDASVLPVGSSIYTVTAAPDAERYGGIDTLYMVEVDKELILYCIYNGSTNGTESTGFGKETLNRLNFLTELEKDPDLAKLNFFFIDDEFCGIVEQTRIDKYKLRKGKFIGKIKRTGLNGSVENFDASVLPVGSSIYTVTTAPGGKQYGGIETLCMVQVGKELILYCRFIEG